jgi:hypothetical protein
MTSSRGTPGGFEQAATSKRSTPPTSHTFEEAFGFMIGAK